MDGVTETGNFISYRDKNQLVFHSSLCYNLTIHRDTKLEMTLKVTQIKTFILFSNAT